MSPATELSNSSDSLESSDSAELFSFFSIESSDSENEFKPIQKRVCIKDYLETINNYSDETFYELFRVTRDPCNKTIEDFFNSKHYLATEESKYQTF